MGEAAFRFHGELTDVVPGRRDVVVRQVDGTSSLLHWVQTIGVPRTEIGRVEVDGGPVARAYPVRAGDVVDVHPRALPQRPPHPPRFACDVHLGTVARRLRLLGFDVAYANDAADDELVALSSAEARTLLTQDRGLLRRRAVTDAAYVRGAGPEAQLRDVVRRFGLAPFVAPLTRCPACNAPARAGREGRRRPPARAGHPALVRRLQPVRRVRPRLLARRAPRPHRRSGR